MGVEREIVHEREGEWESVEGQTVGDYSTTHPPSTFLYLHTVSSSTHSHSPSLSLSERSGRQCASTGRKREGEWEWRRRLCTSTGR